MYSEITHTAVIYSDSVPLVIVNSEIDPDNLYVYRN